MMLSHRSLHRHEASYLDLNLHQIFQSSVVTNEHANQTWQMKLGMAVGYEDQQ